MAENPYVNKVIYGNEVLIDLSEDTVAENTLKRGATAHTRSGEQITGELDVLPPGGSDGDVLVKNGTADRAAEWTNTPPQMGSLATIEPTSSASKAYAAGDYLVYNGQLYKATGTISPDETLTPGGNIKATTVSDNLPRILFFEITNPVTVNEKNVTWLDSGFSLPNGEYLIFASVIPKISSASATAQCRIETLINGDYAVEAINKTGLGNGNGIQGFAYSTNWFRIGTFLQGLSSAPFTYKAYVLRVSNKS